MSSSDTASIEEGLDTPFEVIEPAKHTAPFIFNSPHSGRTYPKAFLEASRLNLAALRKSEDTFVEQLFAPVVSLGAPLMHAHFPRAYLDVNREPYELDPALIAESLPRYANTQSVRVVGGLGTIARIVTESEEIYRGPVALGDALARIDTLYKPYHAALNALMDASIAKFGVAVLIDCHSMPSNPLYESGGMRPDFVLGDRFSTSCNPGFTRLVAEQLKGMGYVVAFNKPYAGGFITEHYGRPGKGRHALQIEVNRALYLNETSYRRSKDFDTLRRDIARLAGVMFEMMPALLDTPRAAAE
ncbi:MAG TPA: N-formylglutamate amidohydrolase [Rhizobiales bacterium]|nr:N-formylglutamate amidohydrolase [bacterium BMS3Bbin10]HDO52815.1 N-formylglutamate amidohydrolase [Hyphomicrobiales bacterium]